MKRTLLATGAALALLALASCSAATADSAEVQQLLAEQSNAAGDSQASMSGVALKRADISDKRLEDLGDQIRIDFGEPVPIADAEFTCFGAEIMDISVYTEAGSGHIGTGATDVRCDDGPVEIDLGIGDDPASAVRVVGFNDAGAGAWAVVFH